jgi:hypothetical protein
MKISVKRLRQVVNEEIAPFYSQADMGTRDMTLRDVETINQNICWKVSGIVRTIMQNYIDKNKIDIGNHIVSEMSFEAYDALEKYLKPALANLARNDAEAQAAKQPAKKKSRKL